MYLCHSISLNEICFEENTKLWKIKQNIYKLVTSAHKQIFEVHMTNYEVSYHSVPYVDCIYLFTTSLQKGKEKSHGKGRTETWTIEFVPKEASKFENYASCGPEKNINESKRNIVAVTTTMAFGK